MWRMYSPNYVSSQAFLLNNIHNKINQEYLSNEAKALADRDQAYAKELQFYLQHIKDYAQQLKQKKEANFFIEEEWNQFNDFLQALETIRTKGGRKMSTLFGVKEGKTQHRFERDMQEIVQAVQQQYKLKNVNIKGSIQLGQSLTNVSFSEENFANDIGQDVLQFFGVQTKKKLEGIMGTGLALQKVPVKIDIAGGSTKLSFQPIFDVEKITPNFNRFAELMLEATFSAKNYATFHSVKLHQSNLLRTLLDLLPQLESSVSSDQALTSFIFALYNRLTLSKVGDPPQTPNVKEINNVLGELDFIYRLTGRGQTYLDIDDQQLQEHLQKGAKYLLYNETRGSKIHVNATRYLIYKRYESLRKNANFAYGHNMRITKTSMK